MSANIFENAMYSLREVPWHRQGYVAQTAMTIEEALIAANCDWEYEALPLTATSMTMEGVTSITVPDKVAQVAVDKTTGEVHHYLGITGEGYIPHTPRELDAFNQTMLGLDIPPETLGFLGENGQRFFLTYKLPKEIKIGGSDVTNMYLFVSTAFDGSLATQFRVSGVRVVCSNTWTAAAQSAKKQRAKIRHSSLLDGKVAAVREALELAWEQADAMQALGERLLDVDLTPSKTAEVIKTLFPKPEGEPVTPGAKRAHTNADNRRKAVFDLLFADTNKEFASTGWGLFNAVTEYSDHESRVRTNDRRVEQIIDGTAGGGLKERVLDLLLV